MKILLLFLLFLIQTFAIDSLIVKEKFFIDKSNSLPIETIIKNKKDFTPMKKYNFGIIKESLWIHIKIKNNSSSNQIKRFFNKRAGLDFVNVYIVKKDNPIKKYSLGDMINQEMRDNLFRVSYFDLSLKPFEQKDIYIKQNSYGTMETKWHILNIKDFNQYFNTQTMLYFAIFGILIVATLASISFYIALKENSYLFYSIFTICSITYQLAVAGFFYEFGTSVYINTAFNYVVPLIALIFLAIFPFSFFKLKKGEYKYIMLILKLLIFTISIFAFLNLFYPYLTNILYDIKYTNLTNITTMFILLILSIKVYLDKKEGSFFYFISNFILFFSITYFILGLIGFIPNNDIYYYSLAFGSISQDIFLGLTLVQATYLMKKEHDKNRELLNEYSKLSFIGQTMVNISHQWKTPINNIYNCINHIEAAKDFKDPKLNMVIDKNLKNIKESTLYLRDTALNQLNFYKEKNNLELINVYNEIQFVIKLIENEFSKKFIDISFQCEKDLSIEIEKNYFLNIIMILFENSFKIFEKRNIQSPQIILKIKKTDKNLKIIFKDNGNGVSDEIIDKIFEKDFSASNSTGIGLSLAKEIINHKLKGEIIAKSTKNGIFFKITI